MRKRKDFTRLEGVKSAKLIVIAAEGRDTENLYFDAMKRELAADNVHVEILHRNNDESSPASVYEQIKGFMERYIIEQDDELWVVVDRDKWTTKMIAAIARYCSQNDNQKFCLSNPCFELWLLLHLEDVSSYSEEDLQKLSANKKNAKNGSTWIKARMRQLLGHYNESYYDTSKLLPFVDVAIERAEKLDTKPADRWPQGIGTRVYLLARSIMGRN